MELFTIKNLTFSYPESETCALQHINLSVRQGEFVILCGKSGCGKSTLLRQLKPALSPHGSRQGELLFCGEPADSLDFRRQSAEIGFVMQNPDNQIVTDKVWHELAFGLESLGYDTPTIRLRVAEMASFFGIQSWFYKDVASLSGGQKQLLNLASIMTMQPKVLILDEPTSQLDPIAAADFLATVAKINRELGTTILMTEHLLEEIYPMASRVIVMENGGILLDSTPRKAGEQLKQAKHDMFLAMPAPMQIYAGVESPLPCPLTVQEGREWLDETAKTVPIRDLDPAPAVSPAGPIVLSMKNVWFKYDKNTPDVVKGATLQVHQGELYAIVGGNGTGKTTTLNLLGGLLKPYRGKIRIDGTLGILPQNPQSLFVKSTVRDDLLEITNDTEAVQHIAILTEIDDLLDRHPYDLSGGEQQRAALAKVLLLNPKILLLDEPTKSLDAHFKIQLAGIIKKLLQDGVTVVMVSHDIEFCARYASRCALFFDGNMITENPPRQFFSDNSFYTTAANRMARHLIPNAVTTDDVVQALGGTPIKMPEKRDKPPRPPAVPKDEHTVQREKKTLSIRTIVSCFLILLMIPLTIFFGITVLDDRKYYFISLLIIIYTCIPFFMLFESREPKARELIILAVLSAIAVAGRAAFYMVPQVKPVVAVVIIAGVCFGGEAGFLVGAVTGFVSNFFMGQGPWTPWQMFCFGIIGFLAGILFEKGILRKNKVSLCIFGGLTTFFIYGGLMNPADVLMTQANPTPALFLTKYLTGIPFDLIHAASTVFFLYILANPMIEKLERIKTKYGLVQP